MRSRSCWVAVASLAIVATNAAGRDATPRPSPQEVAPGVWMIPGGIEPGHQPDGNSVMFEVPSGLVVVDTGRHAWHRGAILALARAKDRRIVAIINTHWHLDHVSGNPALRAAYPDLRVYASNAIDGALTGFLARSVVDSTGYLEDPSIPEPMREDIRGDVVTIRNGAALRPDTVIAATEPMSPGGRELQVHLATNAATAGDVWLYDETTRVAVLGDLVTLPVPFLDTACPDGWLAALRDVAATDFELAIPGHGAPLDRAGFRSYSAAFAAFVACANSTRPQEECAMQWTDSVQALLGPDPKERRRAEGFAAYYVELLRANGGRSQYCAARAPAE